MICFFRVLMELRKVSQFSHIALYHDPFMLHWGLLRAKMRGTFLGSL